MLTGERHFQCNQCDQSFPRRGSMARHMNIHTGENSYECKACDKIFSTRSNLKKHQLIHTGEKPYQCSDCDKEFSQSSTLKGHMRIHTGEKPFKCSYCEKSFSLKFYLSAHMNIHINKNESADNRTSLWESNLDTDLDEEFKNHNTVYETELNESISNAGPTLSFKCTKCDYKSATKFLLVRHTRKHTSEKSFTCSECDYKSAYESNINEHIKNKHNKDKKEHYKKKNTGDKTFACPECPYISVNKNNLNSHIRAQHKWTIEHNGKHAITCEPKKYPLRNKFLCKECNIKFGSKDGFENHILSHKQNLLTDTVHTSEFHDNHNSANNTEKEEKSIENNDIEDDLFECSMCDYTSSSEKGIQAHSLICYSNIDIHK